MRDVAREAGVSVGTVSRVVNNHPSVSAQLRQAVEQAAQRLRWRPNGVAASMRTSSTRMISFIMPTAQNALFAALGRAAEIELRARGYTLVIANTNYDVNLERSIIELMLRRRMDGLLLANADEEDPAFLRTISQLHIPVVMVERELSVPVDSVVSDQQAGLAHAVDYLVSLGHRDIALITGSVRIRPARERHRGYVAALKRAGIAENPSYVQLDVSSVLDGSRAVQRLMSLSRPPTAIVTDGHVVLVGVLRALKQLGTRIPEELSLITVSGEDLTELTTPAITAVRWDMDAHGREAASILLSRLEGTYDNKAPCHVTMATELVVRGSCGRPSR